MSEYEREARRARLAELRAAGLEPFPARVGPIASLAELRRAHGEKDAAALEAEAVAAAVAGRVMGRRSFGKLLFLDLFADGETLQMSARKDRLPPADFARLAEVDLGDFLRVEGALWRTRSGELTLDVREFQLLAKALRPLPEKWHGLVDLETRYRQRYLDLLVNPDARRVALLRSRAVSATRAFLDARGFIEVETPVLQPLYGGAAARPFQTHHNALDQDLYLRISDELYLKRLVVGGLDRVYEIGHDFRNEGLSFKHNPEFSMLECYQAFADYRDMMVLVQGLLQHVATSVLGGTRVSFRGAEIELAGDWPRVTLRDAILAATDGRVDVLAAGDWRSAQAELVAAGRIEPQTTWATFVDAVFSALVEPSLIQPTFVTHHPAELTPLAKRAPEDPRLVERFELFVGGMELANAFSELNDPDDQRARFEEQGKAAAAGDDEAHPSDEDYLRALEHGLPPTGGLGVGIDRVVMVLSGATHIREVILFPHLRPERPA
jgi:lysyl-tRNA synthetase class 2